jgi:fumarate reductase subunit C
MNTPVSARKPYHSKLNRSWWLKHNYYRLYMLREATVLPLLFFIGCLLYGLYCLTQGTAHWQSFQLFMQQGWVIALNLLAFAASLFHAKTFFALFPRVMPLAPAWLMISGQWLATLLVAAGALLLFGGWL